MPGEETKGHPQPESTPVPEVLTDGERFLLDETCGSLWTWGSLAPGWNELPEALRGKVLKIMERREEIRWERRERRGRK